MGYFLPFSFGTRSGGVSTVSIIRDYSACRRLKRPGSFIQREQPERHHGICFHSNAPDHMTG